MNLSIPHMNIVRKPAIWMLSLLIGLSLYGAPQVPAAAAGADAKTDLTQISYEAEDPGNTLTGNASVVDSSASSGGKKVGNLYGGSTLQFNGVQADQAGIYTMTVFYISGDSRPVSVSVNGSEKEKFTFPTTADWNTVGAADVQIRLQQGSNTILFDDDNYYSPDIDKIEVRYQSSGDDGSGTGDIGSLGKLLHTSSYGPITLKEYANGVAAANKTYEMIYNTKTGLSQYKWNGKTVATGIYSTVQLDQTLASKDYKQHSFSRKDVVPFKDAAGKGIRITLHNTQQGLPELQQVYDIYENGTYLLTETVVEAKQPVTTNRIDPMVIDAKGAVDIGVYNDNRVLVAPFDNDSWSRYLAKTINTDLNNDNYVSSELTAVYDNTSRKGLIIGSVTHDTWKTGIYWSGSGNKLNKLNVYGGFTSQGSTHDSLPHGGVTGKVIHSPKIFVGFYGDYRDGLEGYGKANAVVAPPLAFSKQVPSGVPVGWNSWGAFSSSVSYQDVVDTSEFFKNQLQNHSFQNDGNVYINLDSYWDNMTDEQLADLVKIIHQNGQKAGIYYSPFVYWGDNMNQQVEGTNGKYTYGDLVLRDQNGAILPKLDGAYALDVTHPGVKQRLDYYMDRFKKEGFEFIKVDFLSHGALEGKHYDPKVQTGIQAYNEGMANLVASVNGSMFISESIAPLFPSQYAHSRRISCDVDGSIGSTEYELNNLTYGWWQNGTIYPYTDPDYMALSKGGSLEGAQSRVNAAAISGTVFLNSDDVNDETASQYMMELLTNPRVNELATKGKAFRPVEGNTGTAAANVFVLSDHGSYYLAVFNYSNSASQITVDLARAGIGQGHAAFKAVDLWTGQQLSASGQLKVPLKAAESKLYKLTPKL